MPRALKSLTARQYSVYEATVSANSAPRCRGGCGLVAEFREASSGASFAKERQTCQAGEIYNPKTLKSPEACSTKHPLPWLSESQGTLNPKP